MWTIERLSLKYQGIMSQMTKLTRVTKAILRVPNRLFFSRINLPSQMGQQLAQANQTTQANRLSSFFSIDPGEDHLRIQCID